MARRIAAVGRVTVSERRSITVAQRSRFAAAAIGPFADR
jgi:hypothetical protein